MKKLTALLLAFMLPCAALAQSAPTVTANGVVESAHVYEIVAPYTGVLAPFDLKQGQTVSVDDVLFEMETYKVYAPVDGTITAIFAKPGELASDVIAQYGMLAGIEKKDRFIVTASTKGAYDDEENRDIHLGEIVYLEETKDDENIGEGRIISVDGSNYVVEVTDGDFDDEVGVDIYRDDKMTSKSDIGSGTVGLLGDIAVSGNGRVLEVAVLEGDMVDQGDLLFELAYLDADAQLRTAKLTAGHAGALEVCCASGQQAYKGMVLARVHDLTSMNIVAEVDEMDLGLVEIGGKLTVVFDRYPNQTFEAKVTDISRIGVPKQNATYYSVTLAVEAEAEVLPGMNATIWLDK